ncbi:MAG: AAA family ATPase, partial [Patescibacteria group bacterium]
MSIDVAVVTITGHLGSGKTTVAKIISQTLGWPHHYTGKIMRDLAEQRNLTIEEFYKQLEESPDLEKEIDRKQAGIINSQDNIVAEGRMAFF